MSDSKQVVPADNWARLREHTPARIALGHSGGSLPGREVLALQMAHADAKDAISTPLDEAGIRASLEGFGLPVLTVQSKVDNRAEYLQRPDLSAELSEQSIQSLRGSGVGCDTVIVIADGLSPLGVNQHALGVLAQALPRLMPKQRIALVIAQEGRVAIADAIAEALGAGFSAVLIGERPGLSSPASLGIYTTYAPRVGTTNERRNCISNIHDNGLSHAAAAQQLLDLFTASMAQQCSGVRLVLGDEAGSPAISQ